MEHIDNENPSVVKTACEMYKRIKEGSLETENLYEILYSNMDENVKDGRDEKEVVNKVTVIKRDEKPSLEENKKPASILEQTVEKLFSLFFKKKYKPEDYLPKESEFYDYSLHEDEEDDDLDYGYDYAPTVLMNLPTENTRRLISRNHGVPDSDLKTFPCIIGSKRDCVDIHVNDKSVSRMHCQIDESNGRLYVFDLSSSNGTYVNGEKISKIEKEITPGDEIAIGNVHFVLA